MGRDKSVPGRDVAVARQRRAGRAPLRFLICGAVGAGKASLIGRLLAEADNRLDERSEAEEPAADIVYRFFEAGRRRFVLADISGRESYRRIVATGASTADLAVLPVDAGNGVPAETRRNAFVAAVMGVRSVVFAVNKMDAVGYDESAFRAVARHVEELARQLEPTQVASIPVSALKGDNVANRSANMPWYAGPTLMEHLGAVAVPDAAAGAFRFPVQSLSRPDQPSRGLGGTVAGGRVSVGDRVKVLPGGQESTLARIVADDGEPENASAGEAVTLVLADAVGVSPGDVIVKGEGHEREMAVVDQFQAHLVWMGDDPLVPGRGYRLQIGTARATATVTEIKYRLDIETQRRLAAKVLNADEIGVVTLSLDRAVPIDRFADNRVTGALVLADRDTDAMVAAGTVDYPLRRATNVVWHDLEVDKAVRAAAKGQMPRCIWFTGLSGAGKSTVANLVDKRLAALGKHAYVLDGDNVRHGLNRDLGFTEGDRVENIRRIAEVARLMVDAGLIVLVCAISPFRRDREMARGLFDEDEFLEVFVSTPLAVCEARDPKGLYRKARSGEIPNFTGVSAPYEVPLDPDVILEHEHEVTDLAEQVVIRIV